MRWYKKLINKFKQRGKIQPIKEKLIELNELTITHFLEKNTYGENIYYNSCTINSKLVDKAKLVNLYYSRRISQDMIKEKEYIKAFKKESEYELMEEYKKKYITILNNCQELNTE